MTLLCQVCGHTPEKHKNLILGYTGESPQEVCIHGSVTIPHLGNTYILGGCGCSNYEKPSRLPKVIRKLFKR
jgi:hypothetical protein